MKTSFVVVFALTIVLIGSSRGIAQGSCDMAAMNALYVQFTDDFRSNDAAGRLRARNAGKQFVAKFGSCADASDQVAYIRRWLAGSTGAQSSSERVADAEREWKETIRTSTDPYRLADAHVRLGYNLYVDEQYDEALDHLALALRYTSRMDTGEGSGLMKMALRRLSFYTQGQIRAKQKNWKDAIANYDLALIESPDDVDSLHWRGHALLSYQKPSDALTSFSRAIELTTPADGAFDDQDQRSRKAKTLLTDLYMDRADANFDLKNFDPAIADSTKALTLDPASTRALLRRAESYSSSGKRDLSLVDLNKIIELQPKHSDALTKRGLIFMMQDQLESAMRDFSAAIEANPNALEAYGWRGIAFTQSKQFDAAIADFNKLIDAAPKFAPAYEDRGNAFLAQKSYAQAAADFAKYFELGGDNVSVKVKQAEANFELGKYDSAVEALSKVIEKDGKNAFAFKLRGASYFKLSKFDPALADLAAAIGLNPKLAEAYHYRSRIYFVQDKLPSALAEINKAIQLDPSAANFEFRATIYCSTAKKLLAKADERKVTALGGKVVEPCQ
jgi:tetratricopeptide (TPR) repeat protein